ncbi:RNA-directed DNA polymerase [Flavobacterium sp. N1994]|uniref:RNA-directed DNA polymerase n=1 Tax=Flavobacterium sp. N1994 TaxID=2986827 RepID=UPI0022225A87|nr:RNA-directed DNA polymerase [Flavobacterium sp. N1994]
MKRKNNLFNQITSFDNLRLADTRARKGKGSQYGVKVFDRNPEGNLLLLQELLINKGYQTSEYSTFKVYEPKERLVFRLKYFPDRITHHAIMNVMEPLFASWFTNDTYSSIKGKGIHAAANAVKMAIQDKTATAYCLKLDITKFYPNVDHDILKQLLRRKIKDRDLLWILDEIIDSAPGIPIGNYLSQYFANFYLTYFDHWIKETKSVKDYFRYADDIVIFASTAKELHKLRVEITEYLKRELKLDVKGNYQVFKICKRRGLDFVGYVFWHTHTFMRKSIKKNYARAVKKKKPKSTLAAYKGWAIHADTKHLRRKLAA